MSFRIETIAIGDELLTGKISDSNTTFVADFLLAHGLRLRRASVVLDDEEAITDILRESAARSDFVICFGGLGPTSDDRTVDAVSRLLGCASSVHEPSRLKLEHFFQERKRQVNEIALRQTRYPAAATPFLNPRGLAPAFTARIGECTVAFLPGVPFEMKALMAESIWPLLERAAGTELEAVRWRSRTWRCLGIWESELQGVMQPVESRLPRGAWLGYRTRFPENHLTLYFLGDETPFREWEERLREILSPWCYSETGQELEEVVIDGLARQGWRLALAESCTGGLVAQRLSRVAGASKSLWGGYVCYQAAAKQRMLGINLESEEAAVSAHCTRELAESAKRISGCEIGAAITGYMGPEGGTLQDPLGTIYLCVSGAKAVESRVSLSLKDRITNQWGASTYLLNALRLALIPHS